MPLLVHLACDGDVAAIARGGIRPGKGRPGIYAMPVMPNFVASHQWLRELKRNGGRSLSGVYFPLPDTEAGLFGPGETVRIRRLPQTLGWRYWPKAHGVKPCGCPACLGRGDIKSHKLRAEFERGL